MLARALCVQPQRSLVGNARRDAIRQQKIHAGSHRHRLPAGLRERHAPGVAGRIGIADAGGAAVAERLRILNAALQAQVAPARRDAAFTAQPRAGSQLRNRLGGAKARL